MGFILAGVVQILPPSDKFTDGDRIAVEGELVKFIE